MRPYVKNATPLLYILLTPSFLSISILSHAFPALLVVSINNLVVCITVPFIVYVLVVLHLRTNLDSILSKLQNCENKCWPNFKRRLQIEN